MKLAVEINYRKFALFLAGGVGLLALLHLAAAIIKITPGVDSIIASLADSFNMGKEVSVPTWYNQILLFVAAMILFAIGFSERKKLNKYYKHWIGLGLIFIYMSIDEGASLHERFGIITQRLFGNVGADLPFLSYSWVVIGLILVAVVGLVYFKFWLNLPRRTRWLVLLSAIIYVGGAVGVEMIAGMYVSGSGGVSREAYIMTYAVLNIFEESMEMLGVVLFIYVLFDYAEKESISTLLRAGNKYIKHQDLP